MAIHSTFPKGSKIVIILNDRTQIITKFKDKKSGKIITEDGDFYIKDISATSFYKNKDSSEKNGK